MRVFFILPVIVAAMIFAASVHTRRPNTNTPEFRIDRMARSFRGLDTVLPVTTNLAFIWVGDSFDVSEYIYARLLLAPRYCIGIDQQKNDRPMDTVLCVCRVRTPDTNITWFTNGRRILWANADTMLRYILTSTK